MINIKKAVEILKSGGVIAHATDTCYGFACDIFNKKALNRLYRLKQMNRKKPVSIMVSSLAMAKKYGIFTKKAEALARKYWPGPLTIIVKKRKSVPYFLNSTTSTIGIRIPNNRLSLQLVNRFGSPLTTTSANISGKPSTYSVSAIKKQFRNQKLKPDLIINSGRLKKNPPSEVIDASGENIKIIRTGSLYLPLLSP